MATIQVTMEERQFRRRTTVTLYASLFGERRFVREGGEGGGKGRKEREKSSGEK
jgi:hypothetical protein